MTNKGGENKMKKLMVLVLVSLVVLSTQSLAWGRRDKHHGKEFLHRLDLNDQQREMFLVKKQQMEERMLSFRQKNERIRIKMREELEKDHPSREKLHRHIRKVNQHRTDMQLKRIDYMLEIIIQLTPEQKIGFKELCRQRKFRK